MNKSLFFLSSLFLGTCIQAQTILFSENFDSPITQKLWNIKDQDGDADTWEFMTAQDSGISTFSGGFAWSWSWLVDPLFPDNTLISPVIDLPKNENINLKFKIAAASNEMYFQENYAVYILPENVDFSETQKAVFEETLKNGFYDEPKLVNLDLSEYAGQSVKIVFRHYNTSNLLYIGLDDIEVSAESKLNHKLVSIEKQTVYKDTYQNVKISGMNNVSCIKIFDLQGKMVLESNKDYINIKALKAGIYIVNFYNDENVISRKIIK